MSDGSGSDWRKTAYLAKKCWPEAIPEMGPKREFGPAPWPPKTHCDQYGLDEYPAHHTFAASIGDTYGGDVCPYCGVPLRNTEEVRSLDGEEGTVWDFARDNVAVPCYHPGCYNERQAEIHQIENADLREFIDVDD